MRCMDLEELAPDAEHAFGGKACGLARLLRHGARVPGGFAVEATTTPIDQWPEAVRQEILLRAGELGGPLAVRSSAVGEDSASRSFAGLLETVLGVTGPDEILSAAARCIASGGSPRVLAYGGSAAPLAVGLVIQRLVAPRAAGVCFTRDPMGQETGLVLEAVAGSGDRLVSGAARPERWRAWLSGLGTWEVRADGGALVLGAEDVSRLACEASSLEQRLGQPLDLEWALDAEGRCWWLQARPITAASPTPSWVIERSQAEVEDGPVTVWTNCNVRETMPEPLLPLTWSAWREVVLPMVSHELFGLSRSSPLMQQLAGLDRVHGRLYFNLNALMALPLLGPLFAAKMSQIDARTGAAVRELRAAGVLRARRLPGSTLRRLPGLLLAGLRSALGFRHGLGARRALAMLERDAAAIAKRRDPSQLTRDELLAELGLWLQPPSRRLCKGLQMEVVAFAVYAAARQAFKDQPQALALLATGIPANPTTRISMGIDALVEAAGSLRPSFLDPCSAEALLTRLEASPEGRAWLGRLRGFLQEFGHRGPGEFDLGATRWSEDPTMIVELVRAGLRATGGEAVADRMARLAARRQRAIEQAVAASSPLRRPLMRLLARLVAAYMPLREAPKHYGLVIFQRMRQAALELGRRLCHEGVLEQHEDVFLLELQELEALVAGQSLGTADLIGERRRQHERFCSERAPDLLRSDGVPVAEAAGPNQSPARGVLQGTAVSAGRARGPVRVLREPDPRLVSQGDVIVMEFADPGWTPLFPRAAAVVMEVGGVMCHAAVVAREMGIPAVFGVRDATHRLSDDQIVSVDGGLGTVTPEG